MPVTRGLICDLDGTLLNNEWVHVLAWEEELLLHGVKIAAGWDAQYVGHPDRDLAKLLVEAYPVLPAAEDLLAKRNQRYRELLVEKRQGVIFPGVAEVLAELRELGVLTAIGSNSPMENCLAALEVAGLADYFPVIVAHGMAAAPKPAPDIYCEATRRLDLPPAECAVVEDTGLGVAAGKAAGCLTLAVLTTSTPERLAGADRVFPTTAAALEWVARG
ncbi:MAG: HAD family phosphatase [Planctomycetota bacterium]|jgi:HAD superfamily hydrolase (TIGR01509 family)|nr:HAD family phosphatase [Planctomycetota bacterium]